MAWVKLAEWVILWEVAKFMGALVGVVLVAWGIKRLAKKYGNKLWP